MNTQPQPPASAASPARGRHTAEPWSCEVNNEHSLTTDVCACNGDDWIADCGMLNGLGPDESEANAARIVACVNACAGVPDPASAIPALVAAAKKAWALLEDLRTSNPGYLGKLVLQDYANLNEALMELPTALAQLKGGAK